MHLRLAADSRRVEQIVEQQLDAIERLFRATVSEDWAGVVSATRMLAGQKPEEVGAEVVNQARQVYDELLHAASGMTPPKHLSSLLEACRRRGRESRVERQEPRQ
jgi:hypothetical protein